MRELACWRCTDERGHGARRTSDRMDSAQVSSVIAESVGSQQRFWRTPAASTLFKCARLRDASEASKRAERIN